MSALTESEKRHVWAVVVIATMVGSALLGIGGALMGALFGWWLGRKTTRYA